MIPRGGEWHRGLCVVLHLLYRSYNSSLLGKSVVTAISASFDIFSWDSRHPGQP